MQDISFETPVTGSFAPTPKGVATHRYRNTALDFDYLCAWV